MMWLTLWLPDDLHRRLRAASQRSDVSMNEMAKTLLSDALGHRQADADYLRRTGRSVLADRPLRLVLPSRADDDESWDHLEIAHVPGVERQAEFERGRGNERIRDEQPVTEEECSYQSVRSARDGSGCRHYAGSAQEPLELRQFPRIPAADDQLHGRDDADPDL